VQSRSVRNFSTQAAKPQACALGATTNQALTNGGLWVRRLAGAAGKAVGAAAGQQPQLHQGCPAGLDGSGPAGLQQRCWQPEQGVQRLSQHRCMSQGAGGQVGRQATQQ
jgi:hypothetical protein